MTMRPHIECTANNLRARMMAWHCLGLATGWALLCCSAAILVLHIWLQ